MSNSEKDLLQTLVRIPSVNPDFGSPEGPEGGEAALSDFLQDFISQQGWPWLRQCVHPGRENLVAVCRPAAAKASAEVILWEAHQDTVGVDGMKIAPFAGDESHGRIWGRGACDNKGGMAAMLTALVRAQADLGPARPTIVLALTINEENGFTGAKALGNLWDPAGRDSAGSDSAGQEIKSTLQTSGPLSMAELKQLVPTRVIVAEPTELDVVVAHKGCVRWRCQTHGQAAHSSQPQQGFNAIYLMAKVVQTIEEFQTNVLDRRAAHPNCGHATVCVSTIQGGAGINTVPALAGIDIDRRLLPGERPEEAYEELVNYIATALPECSERIEHLPPANQCSGLEDHTNRAWGEKIAATVHTLGQSSELVGVPFGTDAWVFAQLGLPTVVFGPGSIDQAHTDDEWISLDQLRHATEVFYRLACGL